MNGNVLNWIWEILGGWEADTVNVQRSEDADTTGGLTAEGYEWTIHTIEKQADEGLHRMSDSRMFIWK